MKEFKVGQVIRNAHGEGSVWAVVTEADEGKMSYVVFKSGTPGSPGTLPLGSKSESRINRDTAWEVVPPGESVVITEKPVARVGEFCQAKSGTVYMVIGFASGNVPRGRVVFVGKGSRQEIDAVAELDLAHCTKVVPAFRTPASQFIVDAGAFRFFNGGERPC